ncbi:MAG: iron-containing alcohol dehydrogenase [Nitrososphaerales archaeon]|nr:iron-containing alcohol dehydrogenase [Nitrososphaerales archaeon]
MNFSYFLPTKIAFGYGVLDGLGEEVRSHKAEKALIVTDKVMVKTGVVEKVTARMGRVTFDVFDGVEPEPRIVVADAVADKVRGGKYDLVIGVGGGSSMDMAKVAAAFATNEGPARKYVGNNLFTKKAVPSVMIPTTAGTGAELTVTSMVTVEGHKQWINSPLLLPNAALVDPELTLTMPQAVTAATGMDALCHNAEAFLSSLANPITDSAAIEGIKLVVANLERVYDNATDRKAREAMSLGALMGGIALQAKMVYGHSVGYTLATRFRLAHGVSCGLPLPYIISNYSVACGPKMKRLAEAFSVGGTSDDPVALGMAVAERAMAIVRHLKMQGTLKELGVKEEELPMLARECIQMYPRPNSPLVFDEKSMTHFYQMMWDGKLAR